MLQFLVEGDRHVRELREPLTISGFASRSGKGEVVSKMSSNGQASSEYHEVSALHGMIRMLPPQMFFDALIA